MAAFLKLSPPIIILLILHGLPFLSYSGDCSDDKEEKQLFKDINTYRQSQHLPLFIPNTKADCLADKIASQLKKDKPCLDAHVYRYTPAGTSRPQNTTYKDFNKLLSHCHINVTTTADGAILPACVAKLEETAVLKNYRDTQYGRYLKDSNFTHAGIGSHDNWIVVILSTNTSAGGFSGAPISLAPNLIGTASPFSLAQPAGKSLPSFIFTKRCRLEFSLSLPLLSRGFFLSWIHLLRSTAPFFFKFGSSLFRQQLFPNFGYIFVRLHLLH